MKCFAQFFLLALAILFANSAYAESAPAAAQKVVYALKDGATLLIRGDLDLEKFKCNETGVLPLLLQDGWRIKSVHMTASAAVNADQVLGIVVLER